MVPRWTAGVFEAASSGYRRITGYKELWMLEAVLHERDRDRKLARQAAAG